MHVSHCRTRLEEHSKDLPWSESERPHHILYPATWRREGRGEKRTGEEIGRREGEMERGEGDGEVEEGEREDRRMEERWEGCWEEIKER